MRPLLTVVMLAACSGCSIIGHMDEIQTLGAYSREKDDQHRLVKTADDHYDALSKSIDDGTIRNYKSQAAFIHSFGQPILKRDIPGGRQQWLYRYAIYRFAKSQVYVYFDRDGTMVNWEKSPCQKFF